MGEARGGRIDADHDRITTLLVDDHPVVREGFRRLLEDHDDIVVIGEARDVDAAVREAGALVPQVVVLDYHLPGDSGLAALRRIRETWPEAAVLMLSMRDEEPLVRACLAAGARGFLFKGAVDVDLAAAVRQAASGGPVVTAVSATSGRPEPPGIARLTSREREVLTLLCRGCSANEAARELGLSVFTVRTYRASIMRALGVRRTIALVSYALRHRLVDLP